MVVHPMQRGVGKNQIKLCYESGFPARRRPEISNWEISIFGNVLLREGDHFRRSINPDRRAARHGAGEFRRHFAVAAAEIQNMLVAAQLEPGDEFARPSLLHDGIRGIIRRVPFWAGC